jgi:hypothetical protein
MDTRQPKGTPHGQAVRPHLCLRPSSLRELRLRDAVRRHGRDWPGHRRGSAARRLSACPHPPRAALGCRRRHAAGGHRRHPASLRHARGDGPNGGTREARPQDRLHPHHLRHAHHHGRPDGLLPQARAERGGDPHRRLGRDPRPRHRARVRCGAYALAHAGGDVARRRRRGAAALGGGGDREHQRPGDHARQQAPREARSEGLARLPLRRALRLLDAQLPAARLSRRGRARPRPPTSAPTISTASSAPTPSTSVRSSTASASSMF